MKKQVPVKDLGPEDRVDLEGDEHADPARNDGYLACMYVYVINVERETPDCVRVDFNHGSYGFPPEHEVIVKEYANETAS